MIYEAVTLGASAVLLICSILDNMQLEEYIKLTESLGMDALVEAHDADEVRTALEAGARIIGVNNRDLRTFEIDMRNSIELRKLAPDDVLFVSESGIKTNEDIRQLRENNVDAVLIGETLMNAVLELQDAYLKYKDDEDFNRELSTLLNEYAGRPSRLYYAAHMTEDLGGARYT